MNVRYFLLAFVATVFLFNSSCNSMNSDSDVITSNSVYSVYPDKVVQGSFEAIAMSPLEITTNYKSPADEEFSPIVEFRFSFNSRDNELTPGLSHYAVVGENDTTIFKIGEPQNAPLKKLPPLKNNTKWTIKLDMNPMIDAFKKNGYYVTQTGDTIYSDDFKGVWIAGNAQPLTWDFENLYGKDEMKLKPTNEKGIYATTLTLNTATEKIIDSNGWKISAANPSYPQFSSPALMIDALYNMAIDNIVSNIRPDSTFRAGAGWDGVWTRDVSYSTYLALCYLDPQKAMNSLKAKVKNERIIQDTGTGGSWPVSSDRIVWATAAWEIYKVTGDKEWLGYAYKVIKNTLADDEFVVYDKTYGLMHGEQSYLDWREQSYPKWMQPKDIYESMTLGTNILFANAYKIMDEMSDILNIKDTDYEQKYENLKLSINKYLWLADKGYYSEYLYGSPYPVQSQCVDNLGQSLGILLDIAGDKQAESIISKTPVTVFGTTSIYPMIKNIKPYHNNAVWPFVQSFWNLAAAKSGNGTAVANGLGAIYRAAALFATHKELFVASSGDFRGTAVNSDKMLWSAAGNVAMVFRLYAGIEFEPDGIEFEPFVPYFLPGDKKITGFKYRNSILDITIRGCGNEIESMLIDGKKASDNFFSADNSGKHSILIQMKGQIDMNSAVNMKPVVEMPATPELSWNKNIGAIQNYVDKDTYDVFVNGVNDGKVNSKNIELMNNQHFQSIMVEANDGKNVSFVCKPYQYVNSTDSRILPVYKYATGGTSYIKGERNRQYVEVTTIKNTDIRIPVEVSAPGEYFIDIRYCNGNGPINTENKCAIRTLIVNNEIQGPVVMPQRGIGEWMNSGFSNMLSINLKKGENLLQIKYLLPFNVNMNKDVNTALLQYVRLIKK